MSTAGTHYRTAADVYYDGGRKLHTSCLAADIFQQLCCALSCAAVSEQQSRSACAS